MISSLIRNRSGFTLVELLSAILLITILAVVSITVLPDTINESRFQKTVTQLNQIKNAMIGNPEIREGSARSSFGYLGDVGAIPASISNLLSLPGGVAAFASNSSVRFGLGWNGPYLTGENSASDYSKDSWGNTIIYTPGATPPTLVSLGADGVAGGTGFNQDITVTLPLELTTANVSGFICQSGGPFTASAQVELNSPDGSGALTQAEVNLLPANKGQFSFLNLPMGIRSITVYVPSKASPSQTLGPIVLTLAQANVVVPCNLIDISP